MVDVNLVAVLVCGIVSMVLGMIWYNPKVFGNVWMMASGINMTNPPERPASSGRAGSYIINFIGALVMAYVMAHFVYLMPAVGFAEGVKLGFWAWLGFVAVSMLGMVLWEGKPWKYYSIVAGYQLVNMALIAGILAAWA